MTDAIHDLAALLGRLPGIGRRSATRLVLHLLRAPEVYTHELGAAIATLRQRVRLCSTCRGFTERDPCAICADATRDPTLLCVVAQVADLWALEETGLFRGRYHVLHGLVAPLDGVGPDDLRLDLLTRRIDEGEVREVILATRPSLEGEATALLVRELLLDRPVRISRIAQGVPHGSELEYTDRLTLGQALDGRREMR